MKKVILLSLLATVFSFGAVSDQHMVTPQTVALEYQPIEGTWSFWDLFFS